MKTKTNETIQTRIALPVTVAAALLVVLGLFQKDGEKDAERDRGAA